MLRVDHFERLRVRVDHFELVFVLILSGSGSSSRPSGGASGGASGTTSDPPIYSKCIITNMLLVIMSPRF